MIIKITGGAREVVDKLQPTVPNSAHRWLKMPYRRAVCRDISGISTKAISALSPSAIYRNSKFLTYF